MTQAELLRQIAQGGRLRNGTRVERGRAFTVWYLGERRISPQIVQAAIRRGLIEPTGCLTWRLTDAGRAGIRA